MRRGIVLDERYELDQPLGRGGMGEVWRAYDQLLDRRVAVRFITFHGGDPDEELIARFEHEARNTAWLEHPGVPTVYGRGEHRDERFGRCLYLVMQYVEGVTVTHLLDAAGEGLPVGWAAFIAAQACAVLGVAHQRPLVHRDLKPGNLMLCPDGSVKVLDFGLAVALGPADVRLTTKGVGGPGTPGYCAPEQLYGDPGPQSDLYSLGCVLYEMLTGEKVFGDGNPYAVSRAHEVEEPLAPSALNGIVPPDLDDLVLELLAKSPEERPAEAGDVYERLLPFITELEPLGDAVTAGPAPSRLYGALMAGVRIAAAAPRGPAASRRRAEPVPLPTLLEVREAREQVGMLARAGRFAQAADRLSQLVEPAALALGGDDLEVIEMRAELAEALFHGGDHRRAASALRAAVAALAEWHGPDDERVMRYREWEAECLVKLGEPARALRLLEALAAELDEDADRARRLGLLEKTGRLLLALGRAEEARPPLTQAAAGLAVLRGERDPAVLELRALLAERP
ncbi:serine/threonine-protein kinase [Actinomadura macrotermitis]|uniref:non-specific serine/threonine protein kinase n=1 Tax=Actinomadura macrotermitis TaxID=2585200 RepID=A0A7K0C7R3_9ACTN|nr:serine/threonine-protein kinase [Actinomadura macrotermitis]MQY09475.1 Serine/threonine-protein kinase PknD [Actinomadura macrotermitis]